MSAPGKAFRKGITLLELMWMFPDDETAERWFVQTRWPHGIRCPHCGSERAGAKANHPSQLYHCADCRSFFSAKTNSVMHASKVGYQKWAMAIYLMTTNLKGVSFMKLHRDIGVSQKTAWYMAHRIREGWETDVDSFRVHGPHSLPERTDGGAMAKSLRLRSKLGEITGFRQKPLESHAVIWRAFVDEWGTDCWYCGVQQPEDRRFLQLDHIEPNKYDGTNDDCWNRALACVACNSDKGDELTPSETMDKALEARRIQTQARRDEIGAAFAARREWARKRYESLPKAKELPLES